MKVDKGLDQEFLERSRIEKRKSRKMKRQKLKKIRSAILNYLDSNGWPWEPVWSNLLSQVDENLRRYGF